MKHLLTSAAVAGVIGFGALAAATPASAHYLTRRCSYYGCYTYRCDNDGDRCSRVSYYHRDEDYRGGYYHRYGHRYDHRYSYRYDRHGRYDRHWRHRDGD